MKKCKTCKNGNLLPFPVILAASQGDAEAIGKVLEHYDGYIITLSTRTLYDEKGAPHICVDEGIRRRLQTKLIAAVLNFNIA
ncbi:MAG: helix-turn-helix domain-containing protein [Lachnospiraceae bacterium]|nr:helix-turn-helix domain-containing protein [Lachnospiraceae bacterium]MBQ9136589.1 helix-turn-helix domain-containing protein [Lachnospiraceae bacterium]